MSTETPGSAQSSESSGSTEKETQDKVSYETYRRVLNEAKKLKEQNRLYEEDKNKFQELKLKEQNEWKTLAEVKTKQAQELEGKFKELNEQVVNGLKYQEFEKQLGGRLVNKDYATFIDFEKIVINPETKSVDAESVKSEVANFLKNHSPLVDFGKGRMPNEAAKSVSIAGDSKPIEAMTPKELSEYILKLNKSGQL